MKAKILIFTLFIISISFSQRTESIVYLKDGTKKVGYINQLGDNVSTIDKVKFRTNKKSKKIIEIDITKISKIDFTKDGNIQETDYFKTLEKDPNTILKVTLEYEGYISLFQRIVYGFQGNISHIEHYFQKNEKGLVKISPVGFLANGTEKAIIKYFNDCPKLAQYIKNETFKKYVKSRKEFEKKPKFRQRLIEILKYYNSKCLQNN